MDGLRPSSIKGEGSVEMRPGRVSG
jgi:hypothetical protein